MALAPLATAADLSARGVDVSNTARVETALAVASAAVRDAADAVISQQTSTISPYAPTGRSLPLPGIVTAVTSVEVAGVAVTDFEFDGSGLYRSSGWGPVGRQVTITFTHGLVDVPADIVDLTCQLAISWLNHTAGGGGSTAGLTSVAVDDAREGYSDEAAGQVSPVFIPKATRAWLAARFGGGVKVLETR